MKVTIIDLHSGARGIAALNWTNQAYYEWGFHEKVTLSYNELSPKKTGFNQYQPLYKYICFTQFFSGQNSLFSRALLLKITMQTAQLF